MRYHSSPPQSCSLVHCLQEGLLFGKIHRRTINVISDMQGEYSKEETTVGKFHPPPRALAWSDGTLTHSFSGSVLDYIAVDCGGWHDGRGNIDVEQLQAIVASHAPMV